MPAPRQAADTAADHISSLDAQRVLERPKPFGDLLEEVSALAARTLHVAIVTETYVPEVNGVARTLHRVVQGLHARGHRLQLVRPRQSAHDVPAREPGLEEFLVRGLPIPRYPQLRMGLPAARTLTALWSGQRPDLVHVATEGPLGWSAVQAARHLRLPVTSDYRTHFAAYSGHYGLAWARRPISAYLRRFHNRTAHTMVPTPALKDELVQLGYANLRVVSRGVDAGQFTPARRDEAMRGAWGVPADGRVVLHVGRLAPEKNLGLLVKAWQVMADCDPALRLVIVGDGPELADLRAALPGAVFAGRREGNDLAAHYASADLFVFPSLSETFGNVTTEAMASGLAVLAFARAAAGELIRDGLNGRLARPADDIHFLEQAHWLASHRAEAARLGQHARAVAEHLDWQRIAAQVEAVFLEAVAQSRTGRPGTTGSPVPSAT